VVFFNWRNDPRDGGSYRSGQQTIPNGAPIRQDDGNRHGYREQVGGLIQRVEKEGKGEKKVVKEDSPELTLRLRGGEIRPERNVSHERTKDN